MPIPTNNEVIDVANPNTTIYKLEMLPSPSFTFEEHFNTGFDMDARRVRFIMDWAFGKAVLVDSGTDADDTFVTESGGDIFLDPFKIVSGYYLVQAFTTTKANSTAVPTGTTFVVLTITESIHTFESDPSEVGVAYNAQTQSGPNRYWYTIAASLESSVVADVPNSPYDYDPTDSSTYPGGSYFPSRTGTNVRRIQLGSVVRSGGIITVTQDLRRVLRIGDFLTEAFQTEWDNLKNLNVSTPPFDPKYVRIWDVDPSPGANSVSGLAKVIVKWNWDDVQGVGGLGKFTVDRVLQKFNGSGSLANLTVNELAGFRLWLPNNSNFYIITGNSVSGSNSIITVTDLNGNSIDLTSIVVSGSNYAFITCDADDYEVVVVEYLDSSTPLSTGRQQAYSSYVSTSTSPVKVEVELDLKLGSLYKVHVRTLKGNLRSAYVGNNPGLYYPGSSDSTESYFDEGASGRSYLSPFTVSMPTVKVGTAAVGAVSDDFGFTVTITPGSGSTDGWSLSTDYQICWTTDESGANFDNPNHEKVFTGGQLSYGVPITNRQSYKIAVRPIMGGEAVDDPLTAESPAGAGGSVDYDEAIPYSISHTTYSGLLGTVTALGTGGTDRYSWKVELGSVVSPALGSTSVTSVGDYVVGEVMTIKPSTTAYDYTIDLVYGDGSVKISRESNDTPVISDVFYVGVSQLARWQATFGPVASDYDIVRIACEPYSKTTNGTTGVVLVGVYQDARGISTSQYHTQGGLDFAYTETAYQVRNSYGSRRTVVTLYDNSGATSVPNQASFVGVVTIFVRFIVNPRTNPDNPRSEFV